MNLFKLMGNLGNLSKMQEEMQAAAADLVTLEFEGKAGGGLVVVRVNGAQQLLDCSIDPKLLADNDQDLLEDLIVAATNDALQLAKRESAEFMQKKIAERLNMPDLAGLIGSFLPKG